MVHQHHTSNVLYVCNKLITMTHGQDLCKSLEITECYKDNNVNGLVVLLLNLFS